MPYEMLTLYTFLYIKTIDCAFCIYCHLFAGAFCTPMHISHVLMFFLYASYIITVLLTNFLHCEQYSVRDRTPVLRCLYVTYVLI